jgi:Ca2+-binding RTX toxin-like protein
VPGDIGNTEADVFLYSAPPPPAVPDDPVDSDAQDNSVAEGAAVDTSVGLTAFATHPAGSAITYSLTGDTSGGGFQINPDTGVVTVANRALLDGPATHTLTVQASDDAGGTSTATFTVAVTNVAPAATANAYSTDQATAVSGNVMTENTGSGVDSDPAGANDPLVVSSHTSPANGTVVINPNGSFTYTPDSTFSGTDSFTYTISDGDSGTSTATVTISVAAAPPGSILTIPDTCEGGTALLITGTSANDRIVVYRGPTASTLRVYFNGTTTTVPNPSGRIIVTGGDGNDVIYLVGGGHEDDDDYGYCGVTNPAWLYGDAGRDFIYGGGGPSLIFGGDGNDWLFGGAGRDILIGGQGADVVAGNSGDDILIAGYTLKDERSIAGHEKFWCDVTEEWNSTNSFKDRVDNLRGPITQQPNANNGTSYLLPVILDDNMGDQIDFLQGGSGDDWLVFLSGEDRVLGRQEASN